jgi:hypothetical protein
MTARAWFVADCGRTVCSLTLVCIAWWTKADVSAPQRIHCQHSAPLCTAGLSISDRLCVGFRRTYTQPKRSLVVCSLLRAVRWSGRCRNWRSVWGMVGPGSWCSCGHCFLLWTPTFLRLCRSRVNKSCRVCTKVWCARMVWHIRAGPWIASHFPHVTQLCNKRLHPTHQLRSCERSWRQRTRSSRARGAMRQQEFALEWPVAELCVLSDFVYFVNIDCFHSFQENTLSHSASLCADRLCTPHSSPGASSATGSSEREARGRAVQRAA